MIINNPTVHRIDTLVSGKKISILPKLDNQEFDIGNDSAKALMESLKKRYPAISFGATKAKEEDVKQEEKPVSQSQESAKPHQNHGKGKSK